MFNLCIPVFLFSIFPISKFHFSFSIFAYGVFEAHSISASNFILRNIVLIKYVKFSENAYKNFYQICFKFGIIELYLKQLII